MKNFNKYNEENISKLLDHIGELRSEGRLKINPMIEGVKEKIAEHNKNKSPYQSPASAYTRSTFYRVYKNRERLLHSIGKESFYATINFLSERGLLEEEVCKHNLYPAVHDFLSISDDNKKKAGDLTPGLFKTYRPSIPEPGYVVVGLLRIYQDEQGGLKTEEVLPYRINPTGKRRKHLFTGHIWHTNGYYLYLATDDNTQFMHNLILRSVYIEDKKIAAMEGSHSRITTQDGDSIVTVKIYLERVNNVEPYGSGWFNTLFTLGLKKPDAKRERRQISKFIWDKVDPNNKQHIIHF